MSIISQRTAEAAKSGSILQGDSFADVMTKVGASITETLVDLQGEVEAHDGVDPTTLKLDVSVDVRHIANYAGEHVAQYATYVVGAEVGVIDHAEGEAS